MLIVDLKYLGQKIRVARETRNLTQKELAAQTKLSVKTIQDIEKGDKNPTYDTLARLVLRLGIPVDTLFQVNTTKSGDELHHFVGLFLACNQKTQEILLKILIFLVELLLKEQYESENSE